jgi:hypothetical protein
MVIELYWHPKILVMDRAILLVFILTFLINLITTLSYSVRMVGIRTKRIAISFSLFNILILISRTANMFQSPMLSKTVENNIKAGMTSNIGPFRWIVFSCTLGTIVGAMLIPTFQRVLSKMVLSFSEHKSVPKVLMKSITRSGMAHFKEAIAIPSIRNIKNLNYKELPMNVFIMNVVATSIISIGVLASVYAGYFTPEYRLTAGQMSGIINGISTILMFVFIDPYMSALTDDVMVGKCTDSFFRRHVVFMVFARVLGTVIAQFLFVPSAEFIAWLAKIM